MIPSLELLPREFQNRELFELIGPLLDQVSCTIKSEVLELIKANGLIDVIDEYVITVRSVYTESQVYVESTDYIISQNKIEWVATGSHPDEGSTFSVDLDYYQFCSDPQVYGDGFEAILKELLPDALLESYTAFFRKMVKPTLGTKYCIDNLLGLLGITAVTLEWYNTSYLRPFKFVIRVSDSEVFDVLKLIDFVFLLKNERSHLAQIGSTDCKAPEPWDTFYFDRTYYDDMEGITYRGVKICLKTKFEYKYVYPGITSPYEVTGNEQIFIYYGLASNNWVGTWEGTWDEAKEIEATYSVYEV